MLLVSVDPAKKSGGIVGETRHMYHLESEKGGFTMPVPDVSLEADMIYLVVLQVEPYGVTNHTFVRMFEKAYQCLQVIDVMYTMNQ